MITLKQGIGYRYLSVGELHRALGASGETPGPGAWIAKRIVEMSAKRNIDYRHGLGVSPAYYHLSPRFAQEVALWERSETSQVVARAINRQVRADSIRKEATGTKAIVAPIAKVQAVIDGLNDPHTLRAVLFHFIQQNDKQESPD